MASNGNDPVGILTQPYTGEPRVLDEVVAGIKDILMTVKGPRGQEQGSDFKMLDSRIKALLSSYARGGQKDFARFTFFNEHHYVRNFVDGNDEFELMVICWGPGQISRVHNHDKSHCWVACLQGEVQEVLYECPPPATCSKGPTSPKSPRLPGLLQSFSPCPDLRQIKLSSLKPGDLTYMHDRLGQLHSVGCLASNPPPGAITLHLYSPPIKRATLYDPESDCVMQRVPGFYSVRGVKT